MITIHPSESVIKDYQKLLASEWKRSLGRDALSLLWNSIDDLSGFQRADPGLSSLLKPDEKGTLRRDVVQAIVDRIGLTARLVDFSRLPKLSARYEPSRDPMKAARLAIQLSTYLTLAIHTRVQGELEFLVDAQALAFQASIHFALPALKARFPEEHAILLHSCALFSIRYAAYDLAHYEYLMSLVHGYLGDANQRLRCLLGSFQLTSPQDHVYLTKAQEYSMELLDQNREDEALEFLISFHKNSTSAHREEARAMLFDAVTQIEQQRRSS